MKSSSEIECYFFLFTFIIHHTDLCQSTLLKYKIIKLFKYEKETPQHHNVIQERSVVLTATDHFSSC